MAGGVSGRPRHQRNAPSEQLLEFGLSNSFKKWVDTVSEFERALLSVFRNGAVTSDTRGRTGCPCKCRGHLAPSFRHYWSECPRWRREREASQLRLLLPA
eukprot:1997972-Pyramimonas_sp.AAC.1